MKTILINFIIAFSILSFSVNAQKSDYNPKDPKAKEVLDKLTNKAKSYSSMHVEFDYTMENLQEKSNDKHSGEFWIKDKKYKIHLMGSHIYFDGKTQWTHMVDAEEVNVTEPDEDDESILNPTNIFSFYKEGFKYRYNDVKTINGIQVHEIDLFPENPKEKQFTKVRLHINKSNNDIQSIKYFGKDGINYIIDVKKLTPNISIADTAFTFDKSKNPDVEIIDLRE